MSYFVSKDELLSEIGKAVDAIFSAISRLLSEEDKKLKERLRELEANFLLLINTVGHKAHQKNNKKGERKMEEEKVIRPFDDVLAELSTISYSRKIMT